MTHVVTANCMGCKTQNCVEVCPADCFYEGNEQLYIHPEECIDCEACVVVCPNEAIYSEDNVPNKMLVFIQLNEENTMSGELPNIIKSKRKEEKILR